MKNLLKTCFGIFFALFMGVQGIMLQHVSEEASVLNNQVKESSELGEVFIGDYTKSLPIILETEIHLVPQNTHFQSLSHDFVAAFQAQQIHFETSIKNKISLSRLVDLIFDIRVLKFPSHFFW